MISLTSVCWLLWLLILNIIDPEVTNWIGFSLFYSSLFLSILGAASIFGFVIRFIAMKQELVFRLVKDAFRQAFLFSFLVVACLLLMSRDLFSWLNMILLVFAISVFEFFLLSYEKK